ncbi:TPA: hypothetical protein ACLEEU_006274, partial [Pseudomonas aeruginosa]
IAFFVPKAAKRLVLKTRPLGMRRTCCATRYETGSLESMWRITISVAPMTSSARSDARQSHVFEIRRQGCRFPNIPLAAPTKISDRQMDSA